MEGSSSHENDKDSVPPLQPPRPQLHNSKPRELKVEDALLYLDQVKMEFSDKPHIYNEFLDIMKNFKAQSINTPGVIDKVKQLFKGYNKLILGFNTFLPEGEGYKIELTAEEAGEDIEITRANNALQAQAQAAPVIGHIDTTIAIPHVKTQPSLVPSAPTLPPNPLTSAPLPSIQTSLPPPPQQHAMMMNYPSQAVPIQAPPASVIALNPASLTPPPANNAQAPPAPAGPPGPPGAAPNAALPGGAPSGQMQQAHAIHYVTKIRNRFATDPEIYRSFLKILHTYQKEQKGIKEVLEQVSQLFADHSDLLMEFTQFLPDAVQDQAKERLERAARESEARKSAKLLAQKPRKPPSASNSLLPSMMSMNQAGLGMTNIDLNSNPMAMAMNRDNQFAGAKRPRTDRDGKVLPMSGPQFMNSSQFPSNYPMMSVPGMEDQYSLFAAAAAKKQNLPPGATPMLQPNILNPPTQKKQSRRKSNNGEAFPGGLEGANNAGLNRPGNANMQQFMLSQQLQQANQQQQVHNQQLQANKLKDAHVSVSSERRFFDNVKDILQSSSRENWMDFVKCLELFSNDAISKEEMLELVTDLLGPVNGQVLSEFKRLIENRADFQERKEDMWFAVPLSEIDFTQCRKCTPSYRALPRNFPKPKCSERNEEEEKVLNDVWVSIPIGSEESYSFKHMRKNQYEEALFKCEDERFEIDMIIDSNINTVRVLEPIAEEIASFEAIHRKKDKGDLANSALSRISFQLDKRQLSTIHLNAISRIYGDHGEEILDLLRKNPAATIPVILKRLKQKDLEWRKARLELNNHWKEIMEKNHYKSFDHRSFYFRQQDKKYLITKQLVNEIVVSSNNSNHAAASSSSVVNNTPAAPTSATSAAHMGSHNNNTASHAIDQNRAASYEDSNSSGIASSISPIYQHLSAGIHPQMVLTYDHQYHILHRDIFRIVCHAIEHTLPLVSDRERIPVLWRDLIRVFFNIPVDYFYPASLSASLMIQNASKRFPVAPEEAWTNGTKVITSFGSGTVLSFRPEDDIYEVQLPFGKAFLNSVAIYGAEQLPVTAMNAIGVTVDETTGKELIFNGQVDASIPSTNSSSSSQILEPPCKLFYGTQMCYIFLRLHHTLFMRLRAAMILSHEALKEHQSMVERWNSSTNIAGNPSDAEEKKILEGIDLSKPLYKHFLGQVFALVEGNIDATRFEDICRTVLGNKSYILCTLDKIITQLVKHLQAMANDDNVNKLIGLFVYHHNHLGQSQGSINAEAYKQHVSRILGHSTEDVYRFQLLCDQANLMAPTSELAIEHLGVLSITALDNVEKVSDTMDVTNDMEIETSSEVPPSSTTANELLTSQSRRGSIDGTMVVNGKAVVSDNDDDDDSTKASIDDTNSELGARKVVFSPRTR